MKKKPLVKRNELKILIIVVISVLLITLLSTSYAMFNYSRTSGNSSIETGTITFNFTEGSGNLEKGNVFPIEESDIDNTITRTFSITAHSDYSDGIRYKVYVVYGDNVSGKTRLRDEVISFEFTPPADANGFTNDINNCSVPMNLNFVDGKALVASGVIKGTTASTTKNYTLKMFIDSDKINVSSTTKRKTIAEGNPTYAEPAEGTTTATRYMRNDTSESKTITLYPAKTSQEGKIIYTTNEFSNSFYSFKVLIEAEEIVAPLCRRVTDATDLHSETCTNSNASYYCLSDGYELNDKVTYGNAKNIGDPLVTGDAFDCDVNGNGVIDRTNGVSTERFYYVSNYYNTFTQSFDNTKGVLVYYSHTLNGVASYSSGVYASLNDTSAHGYTCTGTNGCNWYGPLTAVTHLPTVSQWSNVTIATTRKIWACSNGACTAAPVLTTLGGTIKNPFSYSGKAARLLTIQELSQGCKSVNGNVVVTTTGSLKQCNFMFEGTRYTAAGRSTYGMWLENVRSTSSIGYTWHVRVSYRSSMNSTVDNTLVGTRPVIDVPYELMEY